MSVISNASPSAPASEQAGTSATVPLELRRAARRTVLAYHELSDLSDYSYALSGRQFAEHLQLAAQLQQHAGDGTPPITLSFDDGHISNYAHALPLLEKYSCKAIFFVVVGRMGQNSGFMNWAQLKEIVALGHKVQSHSWSHKFLTTCTDSDLREELARSKETLEDRLGVCVDALSVPHGRWDRRVLEACGKASYRRLYTSDPWSRSNPDGPVEVIGRLIVVQAMDARSLSNWLTMGHVEAGLRRARYAMKRSAQRMLGNKLYYHLWKRFSRWEGPHDLK